MFNFCGFHGALNPGYRFGDLNEIFILAGVVFSLIMLINCLRRRPEEFKNPLTRNGEYDRIIWAIGILLTFQIYFAGAIVYYFVVKRQRD